jgi:hypothetical protein
MMPLTITMSYSLPRPLTEKQPISNLLSYAVLMSVIGQSGIAALAQGLGYYLLTQ